MIRREYIPMKSWYVFFLSFGVTMIQILDSLNAILLGISHIDCEIREYLVVYHI
jgi:hypothetical protein